ncbi:MBOAT family O-acyltransferase [Bacteroides thetaiotaomicron]|uniref:MBOAT family O-acyltransferase n=1 Tax=Bacteroides thetaiotaomicron TaxID=818 RepID=UPI0039C348F5
MTFQSLEYLIFLPVVFFLYWTVGRRSRTFQNGLIVAVSLVFYGWWDWRFLGLLLLTAFSTFFAGWWMGKTYNQKKCKAILVGTTALNLSVLFFFKYYNFFVQAFIDAFSLFGTNINISTLKILLPVGISFYTFTALSYSIDVYQRKVRPTRDLLAYLAYVTFFPSILSGPISRAQKQLPQYFERRDFDYDKAVNACNLMLMGGVMKLCLADRLGIYVDTVYTNITQHNGTTLLFTAILYTIQIYADFAGYSLMAIGSGKLFGIELQTNFIRPYFSKTVTEFWRRWHVSLTTWFRDYIYFPLGGNRCSKARWIFNTMIVFTVSGLWHGAAYTFLIWGALHGICMVIERLVYGDKIKTISNNFSLINVFRISLTFTIVTFAWIFFRVSDFGDVMTIFRKILTEPGSLFIDADTLAYAFLFTILILIVDFMEEYFSGKVTFMNSKYTIVRWISYVVMVVMVLLFGVLDGGSFIYFQF